jgi:hypothetical protein
MHDSVPYLERLHLQRERFGFPVRTMGLRDDSDCAGIRRARYLRSVTRLSAPGSRGKGCLPNELSVRSGLDVYICRRGHLLTAPRIGRASAVPGACQLRDECTRNRNLTKNLTQHVCCRCQAIAPASLCIHAGRLAQAREQRRQYKAEPQENRPAAEPDAPLSHMDGCYLSSSAN